MLEPRLLIVVCDAAGAVTDEMMKSCLNWLCVRCSLSEDKTPSFCLMPAANAILKRAVN